MHYRIQKIVFVLISSIIALSLLSACGRKPTKLKHISSKKIERPYPQTYPNSKLLEQDRSKHLL